MLLTQVFGVATALFSVASASPVAAKHQIIARQVETRQAAAIKASLLAAQEEALVLIDIFEGASGLP